MRLSLFSFTAIAAVLAFTATAGASVVVKTPLNNTGATTETSPSVKNGIILQNNTHSNVGNNGIILQNNTHAGTPGADVNGDGHQTGTPNPNQPAGDAGNSNGGSAGPGPGSHGIILQNHAIVSPRDHASGLPTGKRQHKPLAKMQTHGGLGAKTQGTHGIIIEGHEAAGGLGSHSGAKTTGGDDGGGDGGNVASPRDAASGIIIQGGLNAETHGGLGDPGGAVSLGPKQDDPSPPPSTDFTATTAGGGSPGGSPGPGSHHVDGITPNPSAGMGQQFRIKRPKDFRFSVV